MATYKKVIGNYQSNADFSPDLVGFQIVEGQFTNTNFYTNMHKIHITNIHTRSYTILLCDP